MKPNDDEYFESQRKGGFKNRDSDKNVFIGNEFFL